MVPLRAAPLDWIAPLRWLAGLLFLAIVVLTIAQVFFRFVLNDPLVWSEECARLCLIWMTFVTAAVVTYDGTHLCVDTFFAAMPHWLQKVVRAVNIASAMGFGAIVSWSSIPLVELSRSQTAGALDISLAWYRAPATVGGVLIVAALALRWLYYMKRAPSRRDEAGKIVAETL